MTWQSQVYGTAEATQLSCRRRKSRPYVEIKSNTPSNEEYAKLREIRKARNTRYNRVLNNGGSFTNLEWNELLDRFNHTCPSCHKSDIKLTVDHIIPVIHGGSSNISNIQPLCKSCNSFKHTDVVIYEPFRR